MVDPVTRNPVGNAPWRARGRRPAMGTGGPGPIGSAVGIENRETHRPSRRGGPTRGAKEP